MTILVAEDDPQYRNVLCETLQMDGHTVIGAMDGVEAFNVLKAGRFDLVISDIQMPKRSGAQLHELVRGDSHLKHIPFIYVTGFAILRLATPLDITGLDFMVSKVPFERLLQLIEEIALHRRISPPSGMALGAS